jgi:hypothetical protein
VQYICKPGLSTVADFCITSIFIMNEYNIQPKTFGQILLEKRARLGISLDDVSADTDISFKYLEALEGCNFSDLPNNKIKDLLSQYCGYLKLDFKVCLAQARQHPSFPGAKPSKDVNPRYLISWPHLIRKIFVGLLVLSVLVFLAFKVEQIFVPPYLSISSPSDLEVVTQKQVTVIGQSEPEVELIINNKEIFVDESGNFETLLDLQKDLNLIKITAKKRYSRVKEVELKLLFKD